MICQPSTGPPSIKYHRWVVQIPVEIDVIRNEDGEFKGGLPELVELIGLPAPISTADIYCRVCSKELTAAWGSECEEGK